MGCNSETYVSIKGILKPRTGQHSRRIETSKCFTVTLIETNVTLGGAARRGPYF
jgi:hypothetical protein